ncbi:MAG: prolyl oligopeptidase family serine peptidase [Bacteroides sp.]|nr:prolyl oligopeptidase family serine peptidase [Bacteroides sp.]
MKKIILILLAVAASLAGRAMEQVDTITVSTSRIASPARCVVAVPDSYMDQADTTHYPVVYLLHGFGDDHRYYASKTPLDELATQYGVIIVCPDGRKSWYWDSPLQSDLHMESYITCDLVPTVDRLYRTIARPSSRAINGLSMGGHGALWLAMRHPDLWGNAASMSGGVDITRPKFHKKWAMSKSLGAYESHPSRWKQHSVKYLAETLPADTLRQVNMMVMCGTEDFFYTVNCDLDAVMNTRKIPHTYVTGPGNHSWAYWKDALVAIMEFFDRNLAR